MLTGFVLSVLGSCLVSLAIVQTYQVVGMVLSEIRLNQEVINRFEARRGR